MMTTKKTKAEAQSMPAYLKTMMKGETNSPDLSGTKLRQGTIAMMARRAPT